MEERTLRNLGALSAEEQAALRGKKVLIAGCGGLGGCLAEYLLRLGVGEIAAADFDRFEPTNLNRQLYCTERTLGRYKAEAAARRAEELGRGGALTGHVCRLDEKTLPGLLRGCDLALAALDSAESRRVLKAACDAEGIPVVFGAISGWVAQAALSLPGDGLAELLYPADYAAPDSGVLSFTCALCAALQASLAVRYLCSRAVEPGKLCSFDLERMDFAEIKL